MIIFLSFFWLAFWICVIFAAGLYIGRTKWFQDFLDRKRGG